MIPHDYHMHSNFSCDCDATMADMCRSAIARGIPEIGFTEHYDLHPNEPCRDWFRPQPWWAELERCRAQFGDQLTIRAGIEMGEPHLFRREAAAILAQLPFDYVIGSLHWVRSESVFNPDYFRQRSSEDAYGAFFLELEEMTRTGDFDILGHFDVPVRTAFAVYGLYEPERHEEEIRAVLRNCIQRGIALDINTAALRRAANVLTPGLTILRWYREMGGERIALGSDAHHPEHVGMHLDVALGVVREAGLGAVTMFERRQARLMPTNVTF
jgi:histidinol-phosphatase (PHP family)